MTTTTPACLFVVVLLLNQFVVKSDVRRYDRFGAVRLRATASLVYELLNGITTRKGLRDRGRECSGLSPPDDHTRAFDECLQAADGRCNDRNTKRPCFSEDDRRDLEGRRDDERRCLRHPSGKLVNRQPRFKGGRVAAGNS